MDTLTMLILEALDYVFNKQKKQYVIVFVGVITVLKPNPKLMARNFLDKDSHLQLIKHVDNT